ncbi:MAG: hypothetical protein AAF402_09300 [Pseudomonadota bacterium]
MKTITLIVVLLGISVQTHASETHQHASPYAGQEDREIKNLSGSDIAELKRGGGWGLAKAAELNGVPGPVHLLELKDEIKLSPNQVSIITQVFEEMRVEAIAKGERLIALERELEQNFSQRTITQDSLRALLDQIGVARSELRYVHLAAHLRMDDILAAEQVEQYNRLRGYTSANPCSQIPKGHDPVMWRKHNGCE